MSLVAAKQYQLLVLVGVLSGGCVDPIEAATPVAYYGVELNVTGEALARRFAETSQFVIRATTHNEEMTAVASFCEMDGVGMALLGPYEEQIELSGPATIFITSTASECDQDRMFRAEVWNVSEEAACPPTEQFSRLVGEAPSDLRERTVEDTEQICESLVSSKYKQLPLTPGIENPGLISLTLD